MTEASERAGTQAWSYWRIARWTAAGALLLTPLVMMQFSDEWHWTFGSFIFAGIMIGGVLLFYEFVERASESRAYRAGVAVALVTSFLTVWTTIVRDDGNGIGFFMLIMSALVGAFAAWFRAAGMARTMFGVAIMQALLGVAIATAPSTANVPGEPFRALLFCGIFSALWLLSAAFFRVAAKTQQRFRVREHGRSDLRTS
jgi:predicted membrane channel-forming protein YqfA (hemolysin III family)